MKLKILNDVKNLRASQQERQESMAQLNLIIKEGEGIEDQYNEVHDNLQNIKQNLS